MMLTDPELRMLQNVVLNDGLSAENRVLRHRLVDGPCGRFADSYAFDDLLAKLAGKGLIEDEGMHIRATAAGIAMAWKEADRRMEDPNEDLHGLYFRLWEGIHIVQEVYGKLVDEVIATRPRRRANGASAQEDVPFR